MTCIHCRYLKALVRGRPPAEDCSTYRLDMPQAGERVSHALRPGSWLCVDS